MAGRFNVLREYLSRKSRAGMKNDDNPALTGSTLIVDPLLTVMTFALATGIQSRQILVLFDRK
jgi:hypothetical protein